MGPEHASATRRQLLQRFGVVADHRLDPPHQLVRPAQRRPGPGRRPPDGADGLVGLLLGVADALDGLVGLPLGLADLVDGHVGLLLDRTDALDRLVKQRFQFVAKLRVAKQMLDFFRLGSFGNKHKTRAAEE